VVFILDFRGSQACHARQGLNTSRIGQICRVNNSIKSSLWVAIFFNIKKKRNTHVALIRHSIGTLSSVFRQSNSFLFGMNNRRYFPVSREYLYQASERKWLWKP